MNQSSNLNQFQPSEKSNFSIEDENFNEFDFYVDGNYRICGNSEAIDYLKSLPEQNYYFEFLGNGEIFDWILIDSDISMVDGFNTFENFKQAVDEMELCSKSPSDKEFEKVENLRKHCLEYIISPDNGPKTIEEYRVFEKLIISSNKFESLRDSNYPISKFLNFTNVFGNPDIPLKYGYHQFDPIFGYVAIGNHDKAKKLLMKIYDYYFDSGIYFYNKNISEIKAEIDVERIKNKVSSSQHHFLKNAEKLINNVSEFNKHVDNLRKCLNDHEEVFQSKFIKLCKPELVKIK